MLLPSSADKTPTNVTEPPVTTPITAEPVTPDVPEVKPEDVYKRQNLPVPRMFFGFSAAFSPYCFSHSRRKLSTCLLYTSFRRAKNEIGGSA